METAACKRVWNNSQLSAKRRNKANTEATAFKQRFITRRSLYTEALIDSRGLKGPAAPGLRLQGGREGSEHKDLRMPSFGWEPRGPRFPAGETGQQDHLTLKTKSQNPATALAALSLSLWWHSRLRPWGQTDLPVQSFSPFNQAPQI